MSATLHSSASRTTGRHDDAARNYDRIAHLYDVDMALNMPFDDVSCYRRLAGTAQGRVLEAGCGNGRVLLALLADGIDACGIDVSAAMLDDCRHKARQRGLRAPLYRMDARRLGFGAEFALVLCPYSLVTYMHGPGQIASLLSSARQALVSGGRIVVDAFVPRGAVASGRFAPDYRRTLGEAILARSKRVTALRDGTHRIERRYELCTIDGDVVQRIETSETIVPVAPDALRRALVHAGFEIEQTWWDYGAALAGERDAQFCTISARAGKALS
jgi:SAM-dependent methyltransferase